MSSITYFSEEIMDQIKSANDIVDVISEFTEVRYYGTDIIGICPFDKKHSDTLLISKEKQLYQCIECGASGDVFSFIMDVKNVTLKEAAEFLAGRAGIKLERAEEKTPDITELETILAINREAALFYFNNLISLDNTEGLDYFRERGLTDRTIKKFGLGYATPRTDDLYQHLRSRGYTNEQMEKSGLISFYDGRGYDKFRNRAMCPIIDTEKHVLGFSGRIIGDGKPKYKNSPGTLAFDKKCVLFGLQLAQYSEKPDFILCEGNMDTITLHQAGYDNAVAPLGTAFTKEQAEIIAQYTNHVHLIFDSDTPGIKAALRAIPILQSAGIDSDVVHLEPCKDPDEYIKSQGVGAFENRLFNAEDSISFEIRNRYGEYDVHDASQKQEMLIAFAHSLLEKPIPLQDQYLNGMNGYIANYDEIKQRFEVSDSNVLPEPKQTDEHCEGGSGIPNIVPDDNDIQTTVVDTSWLTDPDWYAL